MDVEPPTPDTHPSATGPDSWADSETFIRGYADRAGEFGFPVSFFIHPEVTVMQADLFHQLADEGHCVDGLHIHPWKFDDGKYEAHFGGLGEDAMRACVSEAIAMWKAGMGRRPLYFRPGTFSGNDVMFRVLHDLGFRGGSCSIPGRVWRRMNAIWTGAEPDPHRAHGVFRQLVGDLPFANMPVAVDFSRTTVTIGSNFQPVDPADATGDANTVTSHWDLRPDWRDADYETIADNIVNQILARAPAVPVINCVTHNDNDYTDPEDRVCVNFRRSMQAITDACARAGVTAHGTTLADICDQVLACPDSSLPFIHA
jgi:hypothetical protein